MLVVYKEQVEVSDSFHSFLLSQYSVSIVSFCILSDFSETNVLLHIYQVAMQPKVITSDQPKLSIVIDRRKMRINIRYPV